MRFGVPASVPSLLALSAVICVAGCAGNEGTNPGPSDPGGSGGSGTGGSGKGGSGGKTNNAKGGSGGGMSAGGAGGMGDGGKGGKDEGGKGGSEIDAGTVEADAAADGPPATPGEWMGYKGIEDLSQMKKTAGCGMPPGIALGSWVSFDTMVPIPANHSGPGGDGKRNYFVKLPANYDPSKVYKVVIGASPCVNQSTRPSIGDYTTAAGMGGVIQVSPIVEPGVLQFGAYICYDDHDTNSIEYPLIEKMLKEVGDKFCYDQNKVFVQGHSSGGWYSNMMGCVYGSTLIRGMSSNSGGLAPKAGEAPPCKDTPLPGMWIHPTGDKEEPEQTKAAIDRALKLNKCEGGGAAGAWQTAPKEPYTLGGAKNCNKYKCPAAFPVVFCTPPGNHAPISWHPAAAWAMFDALP